MQQSRWERLAPLSGVLSVAIIVAVFAIGGSTPEEHDSAAKVQAFYSKHHDKHAALAFILAIAIPFLLFFVSSLRNDLRSAGGTAQLANAALARPRPRQLAARQQPDERAPSHAQKPGFVLTRFRSDACIGPLMRSVSRARAMSAPRAVVSEWPSDSLTSTRMIFTWSASGGSV